MRIVISLFTAVSLFAADPPLVEKPTTPTITAEMERDFERARADEAESKLWHDADAARLQAALAAIQKACPGVQRPERGKPLVCQPVPVKEAVKP